MRYLWTLKVRLTLLNGARAFSAASLPSMNERIQAKYERFKDEDEDEEGGKDG